MSAGTAVLNIGLVLLLSPLFEGLMRKLKAVIHSRKGPPIIQPYLDILKLLGKEDIRVTQDILFRIAPMAALACIMVAALVTPMGAKTPAMAGDFIVWIYFISMSAVAVTLGAFATRNPYAYVGSSRELMTLLTAEPVVLIALITAAVKSQSLIFGDMATWQLSEGPAVSMIGAGITFLLALQASASRLPFDIPEAETEIMEGAFIEQSGPRLALYRIAKYAKQLILAAVLVQVFVPWPKIELTSLAVVVNLAKILVVLLIVGVIECVNPRLRIDQSMNYFARVAFVALAALALAVVGA